MTSVIFVLIEVYPICKEWLRVKLRMLQTKREKFFIQFAQREVFEADCIEIVFYDYLWRLSMTTNVTFRRHYMKLSSDNRCSNLDCIITF